VPRAGLPDIEKTLVALLMADSAVGALADDRISTELPADFNSEGENRVRLFVVTGSPVDIGSEAVQRPIVQVDSFGLTKGSSQQLASAVHQTIKGAEGGVFTDCILYGVDLITGPAWFEDPSTNVARYTATYGIGARAR
jgi:hypothetical protein